MKKWLLSGLAGITALCAALGVTGCAGPSVGEKSSSSSSMSSSSSSSSSSNSSSGGPTVWTMETAFAHATELGYGGTLEEFMETIQGKDGVGIEAIYVQSGVLFIQLSDGSAPINCGKIKGADGKTPTFKVEEEKLYVSYDDGETWSFLQDIHEGLDGIGIESIEKTGTVDLVDTYTITYSNGGTTTFTVTNGAQGIQGIQGEPGEDGHTPVITIQNGKWHVDGNDTGVQAQGVKGDTGNGISAIVKEKTEGLVDTYTITYTNGTSTKFTITNGANGVNGATPKFKVENDVLSVSYDEGESWEALQSIQAGVDGSSIEKIEKTLTEGLVDTYTITLTDGSTTTFQVTNGAQGLQGIQGEPGEDGKTPVITIQDNYWYINGESTGQLAQGVKGDTGNGISDISYLSSNGHIDTYKITYTDGTSSTFTMNNLSGIDSIEKTGTAGLVDTYTITYSNGKTTTFTVTNGAKGDQGIQGIQGVKGEDGHTPVITIDNNGYWCIDDQSTGILAQGVKGDTGNGISDVSYLSSDGLVDTYVITYTNGDKFTFTIKNGADGANGTNGEDGEDGVGVQTAYIEDGYLYIQLNDGSEPINCGRVGVLDNDLTGTEISATYFQISGTTLTDRVSSITSILYMADEISVAEGATFTVCGDAECNLVFRSKIVELAEGENTFYIKVVNGAESKIYTVNVYRAQAFNVSFDTDGGSAVSGFKIDENETFEAPTTTKLGYTFKGWVTAGGEAYDFSAPVTADVSLTATWELDTYALSYDLAGGTLAVANPDSYNVHTDTITLNEPTRVGYVFDGWYEGETKVTEIAKGSTGAKSLVARWKAIFTVEEGAVTGLADYGKTLSEVVIPEEIDGVAITAIGASAFANATFTVVTIPASVTSIGENAFSGCTALTTAYYLGSSTAWAEIEAALPSGNQALVDAIVRTGLTLSTETVAIKEDQTATVTATAIKEGEEQSVAISWVSNDTGVATVEDGVITGISGGSTTITVSCEIEGTTYTKTITVVITGVERTFTANVQSLPLKVEQESTISVTAKADGAIVADPNVSYSSTSDAVATVDENGKVTAVSVGETTITATWAVKAGVTKTVEIPVVVSSNALTLSAKQYVEMGVSDSAWDMSEHAESLAGYTLSSVTYGSVDVTSAVNASTYAVTNTAFSGATLGEQAAIKLTFVNPSDETDKWHVSGTAMVVTQALRNADDITGFMDVAYVGEKTAASVTLWGETYTNVKYGSWDGYFALANDIDYGGAEYLARMDYNNWVATYGNDYLWGCGRDQNAHTSDLDGIGFCGTFDGQGYTITKLCVGGTGRVSGGFIGTLNTRGVIKNVAFTQAKHYGWGSFLVANGNGTIEDMYIQADWQNPGDSYNPSAWIYSKDCMADARVRRVVINIADYSKDDTSNMYSIGKAHLNYGILNGVYSIGGPSQSVGVLSTGTGAADVYGAYADEATFKSSVDISSWTASVWTTGAGSAVK